MSSSAASAQKPTALLCRCPLSTFKIGKPAWKKPRENEKGEASDAALCRMRTCGSPGSTMRSTSDLGYTGATLPSLLPTGNHSCSRCDLRLVFVLHLYTRPACARTTITQKFVQNTRGNTYVLVLACANSIPPFVFQVSILIWVPVSILSLRPRHYHLQTLHCSRYHPLRPTNAVNTGCIIKA